MTAKIEYSSRVESSIMFYPREKRVLFHVYFWETNGRRNVPKKHGTKAVRPLHLLPLVIFRPCFFPLKNNPMYYNQ